MAGSDQLKESVVGRVIPRAPSAETPVLPNDLWFGAGDGNRTHVASLEGWSSTIELHPRWTE
jgi:hypothetical protein